MHNSTVARMKKSLRPPDADWPQEDLEKVPACPVCGASDRTLEYKGIRDRWFFTAPGRWNIYRCSGCGTGYLDPRPNPSTIGLAYSSYYTHVPASAAETKPTSAWRHHRIAQRNAYLNEIYGYNLCPAAKRPPRLVSLARRQRWDKHVCYLRFPGAGAKLLDVGCGNGRFMMQMRDFGWNVVGVEPDPASANQAIRAGLNVYTGSLDTIENIENCSFDAVSLHHVLEHLHHPLKTLRRCWQLLKPGGVIVIATPNFASSGHRAFGQDWFALQPPTHLTIFTADSLRKALLSAGFSPEPACRLRIGATELFRRSMHIRRKGESLRMRPPLSIADRIAVRWLIWTADRTTRKIPHTTEELVLLASKTGCQQRT
jgi:2-polyprenyl-3-methyl-5-hydroxy-6-metoxy-1,4-benzoquinol methylase